MLPWLLHIKKGLMHDRIPLSTFCQPFICTIVTSLSFSQALPPKLSYSLSFFSQWHELEVIIFLRGQKIHPDCSLNSQSAETLSWHCHYTGGFVPVPFLSLLTFCVTLAALLPIKKFITPRQVYLAYKAGLCWKCISLMCWFMYLGTFCSPLMWSEERSDLLIDALEMFNYWNDFRWES